MKDIEYKDLPSSWAFCFNENCERKDSCMRQLTTRLIPDNKKTANVVLPSHYCNNACEYYHEKRIVTVAWGFELLFTDVKAKDIAVIRKELFSLLDSRTSYYRYAKGERFLTPEQQEEVLSVFRRYGYTTNLQFDHYKEAWGV